MNLYTDVNLKQNEVQFAVIHPLANAPSGVEGQVYYNTTDDTLYMHDGTQWKPVGVRYEIEYGQATDSIALNLVGSDGNTDTVYLKGAGGATLSVNGDTLTITSKDYPIGTKSQLETGTSQSESVWTPEILHDYVMDRIGEIPADQFLDLNKTEFVQNFSWSAVLYPGSTDPNLDGKPVLVLALTDGDTTAYSFLNMESLISAYTGTAPINVNGSVISLDDSGATAGSFGDANNMTPSWGESFKALFATINSKGLATLVSEHNVTIPDTVASATSKGLMSAEDKQKLDLLSPISYTQVTGKPTGNQEPDFGDTVTVSQISQATSGQVSALDRTIKIPDTLASDTNDGLMSAADKDKLDNVDDIYNTECGDIVTIDDAQPDSDVTSLQVTLEPVQDNEYDSVWSGGNGKNKLPNTLTSITLEGVTATVNSDGSVTVNGTPSGSSRVAFAINSAFTVTDNTMILNGCPSGGGSNKYELMAFANNVGLDDYGSGVSLSGFANGTSVQIMLIIRVGYTANNLVFKPMIRKSTESADYEPYSNICPITGHDSVGANVTGKNLLSPAYARNQDVTTNGIHQVINADGSITLTGTNTSSTANAFFNYSFNATVASAQPLDEFVGKQVIFNCLGLSSDIVFALNYFRTDGSYGSIISPSDTTSSEDRTFTVPNNCAGLRFFIAVRPSAATDVTLYPMLRLATDTDPTWKPYTGSTYTATLPQTVYGGNAELVGGTGKSTMASVDLGTLTWNMSTRYFSANLGNAKIVHPDTICNGLCSQYNAETFSRMWNNYSTLDGVFSISDGTDAYVRIRDTRYATAADFKTAMSGVQLVYELATPTDLTFTPQSITLHEGANNVWSEQGDVCVSYIKDRGELGEFIADTQKNAFRNFVDGNASGSVRGINTTEEDDNYSLGYSAFAQGEFTEASGDCSHAEGEYTTASEIAAHAEGYNTQATKSYTHAEGYSTTASYESAHAEGDSTTASRKATHAEGKQTTASSDYAHAEGLQSTASGKASHAEGAESQAVAEDSHAEGYSTVASSRATHAEGYDTTVQSGMGSHAEGYQTLVNVNNTGGYGAHAEGYLTQATTGHGAHAEGESTTAGGYSSHAEGYGTSVTAVASVGAHAEGYETIAEQDGAHAEGKSTRAAGIAAHAEGLGTKARSPYQHVFGRYNQEDTEERYVELVGNGTSSARSNARSLDWYGNEILAGKLTVGTDPVYNKDVTTKQYVDARVPTPYTRTLSASGWSASNTQTVNITGLTTSSTVIVSPDPTSMDDYVSAGVKCTAQAAGYLTFTCDTVPTANLTVNILVVG